MGAHLFKQIDRTGHIIIVIHQGLFNRFAHRLKPGKMNYLAYVILLKYLLQRVFFTHIRLIKFKIGPRYLLDSI